MTQAKKQENGKCGCCIPENSPETCKFATAKIIIDGKEHPACCVKCTDVTPKQTADKENRQKEK